MMTELDEDTLLKEIDELLNNYEGVSKDTKVAIASPTSDDISEEERYNRAIKSAKMWASHGNMFSPCEKAVETLPAGQYTIENSQNLGLYFREITTNIDDLIELPDSASEFIVKNVEEFWSKEEVFRNFGFLWKRGVLMWGPPGSGKTSTLQILIKKIIERNGLAVFVDNPHLASSGLRMLRVIEPTRPIVVLLEDLDAIVRDYGESSILALLDGELQIDNVVFIATTNYPERLDARICNRPSRFDVVKKIGMPSPAARKIYLSNKNPRFKNPTDQDTNDLEKWVKDSEGFSIAHLKELIILIEVFGTEYDVAIKRLQKMCKVNISSDMNEKKIPLGFTSASDSLETWEDVCG